MGSAESSMSEHDLGGAVSTLPTIADYIVKSGKCKKIVVLTGAGISTSAGIPDFRSPDTGLYANLARLDLPFAEAVFDISYFRRKPEPFYTLARDLYPGKFRPTLAHSFIKLLSDKGLLLKHFTQNIDCLDREAGVPDSLIVEAHGSFARQSCIECKADYPADKMLDHVRAATVPRCVRKSCNGLVKPEIVFFGEALPREFFSSSHLLQQADLVIIMGTSLTVYPFAGLPQAVPQGKPRVLINLEQVGSIGSRAEDVLLLGDCDAGVRKFAQACGWEEELDALWQQTGIKFGIKPKLVDRNKGCKLQTRAERDAALEREVEDLTSQVDQTLKLSDEHSKRETEQDALSSTRQQTQSSSTDKAEAVSGLSHVFPHLKKDSSL